jgi:hypothetical protein
MKAITPHATVAAEDAVHALGDPNGKTLEPARQRPGVQRLDDEMHVIPLHRELEHPEVPSRSLRQGPLDGGEHGVRAQRRKTASGAERRMQGVAGMMSGPSAVGNAHLPTRRLATGADAPPAPGPGAQLELDRCPDHE